MARRKKNKPVRIIYASRFGPVEYVSRMPDELPKELDRLLRASTHSILLLNRLKRYKHGVLIAATGILKACVACVDQRMPANPHENDYLYHIARTNQTMQRALDVLSQLKHCKVDALEEVRFKLLYGQTPRKREMRAY